MHKADCAKACEEPRAAQRTSPYPMKATTFEDGKELRIKIEDIASTGLGVGYFIEDDLKKPVFVPHTVPGDLVLAKLTKQYKKYYEARTVRMLQASKDRIAPVCKHFGLCGACDFLHMDYGAQLAAKERLLRLFLTRQGIDVKDIDIIRAKKRYHYRDKIRVAITAGHYGYYSKRTNTVIRIKHCYAINEKLNAVFLAAPKAKRGEESFAYDCKTGAVISEHDKKMCHYHYDGIDMAFYPDTFVQNNLQMDIDLIRIVLGSVHGKEILDLYAGNGNFTLPLAKAGCRVCAVEGDKRGFELLEHNLKSNRIGGVQAINDDVRRFVSRRQKRYDTIVLDPPRTGASDIIEKIAKMSDNIIYISCNALSLSKELKAYLKHGFAIQKMYLIDMFPNTRHFETIAVLRKGKPQEG